MKNFFGEQIYILGLERNDTKKWRDSFHDMLPKDKVRFWIEKGAQNTKNDGQLDTSFTSILSFNSCDAVSKDIFHNHVKIYQDAWKKNFETILILEDDVVFPHWNENKWEGLQHELIQRRKHWDICYLGYCQWPILLSTIVSTNVVKLTTPLTTHAYLISRTGIEKFLYNLKVNPKQNEKYHIDKALQKTPHMKLYGAFPMMAFQKSDPALYTKAMDKMNVSMSFQTFCKVNEWVSVSIPIAFLLLIIISVSAMLRR